MALKRKRSSQTFTSSPAHVSSSPIPFFYTQSKPIDILHQKPTWSFPTYEDDLQQDQVSSRHLNSRTRKRHRDGRPDEESVYASTLSRLFDAQRQHPKPEPTLSQPQSNAALDDRPIQKSTLHAFWDIHSAPQSARDAMAVDSDPTSKTAASADLRCEDCDGSLRQEDAMQLDDGILEAETACAQCRRHVCERCAVLGNERVCLGCANGR